jgi:hypothetical protein
MKKSALKVKPIELELVDRIVLKLCLLKEKKHLLFINGVVDMAVAAEGLDKAQGENE